MSDSSVSETTCLLRGTRDGTRFHIVYVRESLAEAKTHAHPVQKALCGTRVSVSRAPWSPRDLRHTCRQCLLQRQQIGAPVAVLTPY
jgi:hypothetical protein